MKLHKRYLGCINWPGVNQISTFSLPRNYALVALEFELVADLTRTIASGTAGGPADSAPAQLVRNLDIIVNGSDTIKHMDFETLHRKNQLQFGTRPRIYAEDWSGYANAADKVLKVASRMSFAMPRAIAQVDTLLDTTALSSLDLVVTWGAGLDTMNDGWAGNTTPVVSVNDAKLHITAIEYIGVVAGTNFALWKENWLRKKVVGVDNTFQIKLPFGSNINYRSILLKTHSDGDQVDTIIPYNGLATLNKITLKSGTEVYLYQVGQLLTVQNRLQHAIEVPERTGSAAALNHRLQELTLEGYYYIDFCRDGRLSEMLDTSMLSDLELSLEVVNPGSADYVDVYFDHLFPPPKVTV
ncbi:hypothetical protein LCGC14_0898750 [marine sediment metagenome]|uniref:Uncharacterized protein n=1 Tax=marine sediment metagenome TaxID=412755 RepID=A0A0F9RG50_9ZZZZ